MSIDVKEIQDRIATAAQTEMSLSEALARDVAFHMTDWISDLEALHRFYQAPDELSSEQLSDLLLIFLSHVPNHVAAAGKLYAGFPVQDIFKVGATTADDN